MKNNVYNMLGLAMRARQLVSGEGTVLQAIQKRQVSLVILAGDASERTTKKFQDKCKTYHIPLRSFGTQPSLGRAIGKPTRTVLGITDSNFSKRIVEMLEE